MGLFGKKEKKDVKDDKVVDKKSIKPTGKTVAKQQEVEVAAKPTKKAEPKPATKVADKKIATEPVANTKKAAPAKTDKTVGAKGKFIIKKAKENYVFALQAANFQNVATSGSGYKSLDACKLGVESTKRFLGAPIEDQTLVKAVQLKNPKYEIYLDKAEQFRFRLKANNGEIILVSDSYSTKTACKKGIDSIQRHAPTADIEVQRTSNI